MADDRIEITMSAEDLMKRWPATIEVFMRHRMACVGCPASAFHSIADCCKEYRLSLPDFMIELGHAAAIVEL
jgi:hybrid cluster-associated redox disulfide protein